MRSFCVFRQGHERGLALLEAARRASRDKAFEGRASPPLRVTCAWDGLKLRVSKVLLPDSAVKASAA